MQSRDRSFWTAAALSFLGGVLYGSYAMRLRDRERLRKACSRIQKHLKPPQRMALGPIHLRPNNEKETILVVGAGAYGTFWKSCFLLKRLVTDEFV